MHRIQCGPFVRSLVEPAPRFAKILLRKAPANHAAYMERVRSLYFFLLEKRYTERLNLLYFAFNIFDDDTALSDEVVNQTPFPHEKGSLIQVRVASGLHDLIEKGTGGA